MREKREKAEREGYSFIPKEEDDGAREAEIFVLKNEEDQAILERGLELFKQEHQSVQDMIKPEQLTWEDSELQVFDQVKQEFVPILIRTARVASLSTSEENPDEGEDE
jgi:hypothetical protein